MICSGSGRWTSVITFWMRSRRAAGSSRVWVLSTSSICAPQLMTGLSAVIGSWKIIDMRVQRSARRRFALACSRSSPSSRMRPATGVSWPLGKRPMMLCAVTDLPEPDSPTRQRISRAPHREAHVLDGVTAIGALGQRHRQALDRERRRLGCGGP